MGVLHAPSCPSVFVSIQLYSTGTTCAYSYNLYRLPLIPTPTSRIQRSDQRPKSKKCVRVWVYGCVFHIKRRMLCCDRLPISPQCSQIDTGRLGQRCLICGRFLCSKAGYQLPFISPRKHTIRSDSVISPASGFGCRGVVAVTGTCCVVMHIFKVSD